MNFSFIYLTHHSKRLLLLFFMLPVLSHANFVVPKRNNHTDRWILTAGIGPAISFNDIKQNKIFPAKNSKQSEWRPAGFLQLEREITKSIRLRGTLLICQLSGFLQEENQYFEADVNETSISVSADLFRLFLPGLSEKGFKLDINTGAGFCFYYSSRQNLLTGQTLVYRGQTKGFGFSGKIIEGIVIAGITLANSIDQHWTIQLESGHRVLNADNMESLTGGFPFDSYNIVNLGVSYKIFNEWNYPIVNRNIHKKLNR